MKKQRKTSKNQAGRGVTNRKRRNWNERSNRREKVRKKGMDDKKID